MHTSLVSCILLLASVPAQELSSNTQVVRHPERLRFESSPFVVPPAEDFRHRLSNGIPVYVVEDHTLPLVDVTMALPVGDYLDSPDQPGLASLTAAMLRRGGSQRLTPEAFDEAVDLLGAELDSHWGTTRAGVNLNCSTSVLDDALRLMVEMLRSPRFDRRRLEQAKANLLEGMKRRGDDPLRLLDREWRWLISGSDHFESRQLGASQLVDIEPDDLLAFYHTYWLPSDLVVAVSGDVSTPAVLAQLELLLGGWQGGSARQRPSPWAPRRPAKPGLYHLEIESPQVKVALGHLGAKQRSWDDPDSWALILMREVLGGDGTVSRLSRRLRAEDHLVYRVRSHFGIGQHLVGEFQVFFESEGSSVAPAVRRILEVMRRLQREPVPAVELALAKRTLINAFPLLFDSAEKIAGRFAEDVLLGRPHSYWQKYRQRIAAISSLDVQRAARRYLQPTEVRLLAVGPWNTMAVGKEGTRLETLVRGKRIHLPQRDPLTLESLPP